MSRSKNTMPRNKTSKGDAIDKWTPNKAFYDNYDRIFSKKKFKVIKIMIHNGNRTLLNEFDTWEEACSFSDAQHIRLTEKLVIEVPE